MTISAMGHFGSGRIVAGSRRCCQTPSTGHVVRASSRHSAFFHCGVAVRRPDRNCSIIPLTFPVAAWRVNITSSYCGSPVIATAIQAGQKQ
jgi:hypothetical protein